MSEIKDLITRFNQLLNEIGQKGEPMGRNNQFNGLAQEHNVTYAGSNILPPNNSFLDTSPIISFGLGRFTSIPWIVFTNYEQEVMNGIYPVLLYYTEQKKVLLCYGISESNSPRINWDDSILKNRQRVDDVINSPEKYGASFVHQIYDFDEINQPNIIDKLIEDLKQVIEHFHSYMKKETKSAHAPNDKFVTDFLGSDTEIKITELSKTLNLSKLEAYKKIYELYINGKINISEEGVVKTNSSEGEISVEDKSYVTKFPFNLTHWGANKPTAVRIPFSNKSGRPAGKVIKNKLIITLDEWIDSTDRINNILLIGGPGNGKTDALEYIIDGLINKYSLDSNIKDQLSSMVQTNQRNLVVHINSSSFPFKKIVAVPEASTGTDKLSKEEALYDDFKNYLDTDNILYISCINRGVLEDLKTFAHLKNDNSIISLIDDINEATKGKGKETWPLLDQKNTAVWFMDIESLFDNKFSPNPSQQIIDVLAKKENWEWYSSSRELQEKCPLYDNYIQISQKEYSENLCAILRNYERITENKLNFRNYFSLLSSLFANNNGNGDDPLDFSIGNLNLMSSSIPKEYSYIKAVLLLSMSSYGLRLFRDWEEAIHDFSTLSNIDSNEMPLLKNFLSLWIDDELTDFLTSYQSEYEKKFIKQLNEVLDPFHSDHPEIISITEAFSINISEGHKVVKDRLNYVQNKLLEYFIMIEDEMRSSQELNKIDIKYDRLIQKLRSFAAQISSRVIGTKQAYTKDYDTLAEFNRLHNDFSSNQKELKRMFRGIAKARDILPLHSFGQPKPDLKNAIIIRSDSSGSKFNIEEARTDFKRASQSSVFFEHQETGLVVPLSYNLFKALSEINSGVNKNSVNSNINALIERMESLLYSQFLHVDPQDYDELKMIVGDRKEIRLDDLNKI